MKTIIAFATNRNSTADEYIEDGGLNRRMRRTGHPQNSNEAQFVKIWMSAWRKWNSGQRRRNSHYKNPPMDIPTLARFMGRSLDEIYDWIKRSKSPDGDVYGGLLRCSVSDLALLIGRPEGEIQRQWKRLERIEKKLALN